MTQDVLFKVYRKVGDVPRRRRAVVLDLPHHVQRGDVAAADGRAISGRRPKSATQAVADGEDAACRRRAGRRRLVATWPTSTCCARSCAGACSAPILALPAIYRAPVMLRDIQGMSTEEASAMLRVKDQTLKSRLHRGRLILRKQLADFAGGLTLHRPVYGT